MGTQLIQSNGLVFTPRERDVVFLLSKGLTAKDIANRLNLSYGTIKVYLHRLYHATKLNRYQLMLLGLKLSADKTKDFEIYNQFKGNICESRPTS